MAPPNKVINHIDKDEIIRRLTNGESVRDTEAWLQSRYPSRSQAHLTLSASTLQAFRADHLNLKGKILSDLTEVAQQTKEAIKHEMESLEIQASPSYQEKLNAIVAERLDTQRELIEIFHILKSRVEVFYNNLKDSNFSEKQERAFSTYLTQMMTALESYKKFVEGHVETTHHNVQISVVSDQVGLIREAVRETLSEMDQQLAVQFMAKLSAKMKNLEYKVPYPDLQNLQVLNG